MVQGDRGEKRGVIFEKSFIFSSYCYFLHLDQEVLLEETDGKVFYQNALHSSRRPLDIGRTRSGRSEKRRTTRKRNRFDRKWRS